MTPPQAPRAAEAPRPLERSMGIVGVLFLTLSSATPASSFFVIVPDVLRQAGTGAVWAMAGAAVVAGLVAQVYAELASAFPYAGGEYAMTARVLGAPAGFAMLAVNGMNCLLATAVLSLGMAEQLGSLLPGVSPLAAALACVAIATALGVLNVRANAWITGVFLILELAALAAVAAMGAAHPARSFGEVAAHAVAPGAGGALVAVGWGAVGLAGAGSLFAYDGYGSAVYFAEELQRPRQRIAQAVTLALALVVACEFLPLIAVLVGAPDLAALLRDGMWTFVQARAGPVLTRALQAAVALAVLNAVIALMLLSARQIYAAARDQVWPRALSRVLLQLHPRWRSPWAATLVAGGVAAALCLLPLRLLVLLTGSGVTAVYAGLCVALLVGRRTGATAGSAYRLPLFPWLPIAALAALAAVLAADAAAAGDGRTSLLVTLAVGAAAALWGARAGSKGAWRLTAPADDDAA